MTNFRGPFNWVIVSLNSPMLAKIPTVVNRDRALGQIDSEVVYYAVNCVSCECAINPRALSKERLRWQYQLRRHRERDRR